MEKRATNRATALLLVMLLVFTLMVLTPQAALAAGGTGTPDDTWYDDMINSFIISDADQLAGLAELVNSGKNFSGKTATLADDIDLSVYGAGWNGAKGWIPIGAFNGTFDGDGHKITGLFIDDNSLEPAGLFASAGALSLIKNLGVEGTVNAKGYAGGIVGTTSGAIENCYSACVVTGTNDYVGGIAGKSSGSVKNCYSTGDVHSDGNFVGGIAGDFDSWLGIIEYCYAIGAISGGNSVGGIAGYISSGNSTVRNCVALNPSVSSLDPFSTAGRVASGSNSNNLANNYAFDGMTVAPAPGVTSIGGADMTDAQAKTASFWTTGANWSASEWSIRTGSLPSLLWQMVTTVPGAPTNATATAGNGRATVSFTPPADNGGSPITSYTVTSSPGGVTATGAAGPVTVTGLQNGTAYTFTVTATNAIGAGPPSAPSNSVTPSGNSGSGGNDGGTTYYTVTFETNGGSAVKSQSVAYGAKVSKPADPAKTGFTFTGWYVDKELAQEYDFSKVVTGNITIYAAWSENKAAVEPEWENPFIDVNERDWFYGDVKYVCENGLMTGTGANTFSPETPITRGMIVTILYRQEGSPDVSGLTNPFDDVAADKYYTDAVKWAAANSIVEGYGGGTFGPENSITRQDLAVILWRYAQYAGLDVSTITDISAFTDASTVAEYAADAMRWACGAEIITGKQGNLLDPQGTATRAETAAMLHRMLGIDR